jgi:hypothetical protein
MQKMGQ